MFKVWLIFKNNLWTIWFSCERWKNKSQGKELIWPVRPWWIPAGILIIRLSYLWWHLEAWSPEVLEACRPASSLDHCLSSPCHIFFRPPSGWSIFADHYAETAADDQRTVKMDHKWMTCSLLKATILVYLAPGHFWPQHLALYSQKTVTYSRGRDNNLGIFSSSCSKTEVVTIQDKTKVDWGGWVAQPVKHLNLGFSSDGEIEPCLGLQTESA